MPAPLVAAKAAQVAWSARRPLAKVALAVAAIALSFLLLPFGFALAALALVGGADQACAAEMTAPAATDASAVRRAAQQRRAGPIGSALVAALADEATRVIPTPSLDAAGPFRLPAAYAAGLADGQGRWRGPQDPVTGDAARDSRQVTSTATRAVLRRLHRTDPAAWKALRDAPPSTDADVITTLAATASTLFTAAFPHAPLSVETARAAITGASVVDTGGSGDLITGGVLVIGDPARLEAVQAGLGHRAFGGEVRYQPTSPDPAAAGEGAWRDLAAAEGLVLAVTTSVPAAAVREDLQDATNATVVWIAASGTADPANHVYVAPADLSAVLASLAALPGADAPASLCEAVLGFDTLTTDPLAIIAPDPSAYAAIAYAQAQLGKPYSYSAIPPVDVGLLQADCRRMGRRRGDVDPVELQPVRPGPAHPPRRRRPRRSRVLVPRRRPPRRPHRPGHPRRPGLDHRGRQPRCRRPPPPPGRQLGRRLPDRVRPRHPTDHLETFTAPPNRSHRKDSQMNPLHTATTFPIVDKLAQMAEDTATKIGGGLIITIGIIIAIGLAFAHISDRETGRWWKAIAVWVVAAAIVGGIAALQTWVIGNVTV